MNLKSQMSVTHGISFFFFRYDFEGMLVLTFGRCSLLPPQLQTINWLVFSSAANARLHLCNVRALLKLMQRFINNWLIDDREEKMWRELWIITAYVVF